MSGKDQTKSTLLQWISYFVMLSMFLVIVFAAATLVDYLRTGKIPRL